MGISRKERRRAHRVSIEFPEPAVAHRRRWTRDIRAIMRAVPEDDLVGLSRVIVVHELKSNRRDVGGLYVHRNSNRGADVREQREQVHGTEIFLSAEIVNTRSFSSLFALPRRGRVAYVLLHEFGHHCHYKRHGVKKRSWESWANEYRDRIAKRLFPWRLGVSGFLFCVFCRPLRHIARFALRGQRKKRA